MMHTDLYVFSMSIFFSSHMPSRPPLQCIASVLAQQHIPAMLRKYLRNMQMRIRVLHRIVVSTSPAASYWLAPE